MYFNPQRHILNKIRECFDYPVQLTSSKVVKYNVLYMKKTPQTLYAVKDISNGMSSRSAPSIIVLTSTSVIVVI